MEGDRTGQNFAQYRIDSKLGQGGMGSVYRAWDESLQRWVAIKMLEATGDQSDDKRKRFLMEARAVSALNHPNIVTIHEIGQKDQLDYIVMEFVAGKTLHTVIQESKGLSVVDVLKYAVQISDALSGAHAAGITHRDLKPANIMVTERGRVKVVDFGLAKRLEGGGGESGMTRTMMAQTQRGFAVGTLHYMSPEQAQGKPVDGRSDIFAFGAVLYEMLTGRLAFGGDSMAAIMVAIMTQDPPPVSTIRPVPEELDRLIARCLRKDLERRIQHVDDLKIALEEMRAECEKVPAYSSTSWPLVSGVLPVPSTSGYRGSASAAMPAMAPGLPSTQAPVAAQVPRKSRTTLMAGGGVVLAAALAAGWFYYNRTPTVLTPTSIKRLTSDIGLSGWPALSRDGKFLAYASDRGETNNLHIWLQQIGGGAPIQLTNGDADDVEPAFSPDGTRIAFRSARDGGGIYVVSTLGGDPRLLARSGNRPQFSPDGLKIVYWIGGDIGHLYVVDASGGAPPQQLQTGFPNARFPVWSPDGKSVMFESARTDEPNSRDWFVAPLDGRKAAATGIGARLRAQRIFVNQGPAAWLSNNEVLFSGQLDDVGSIWSVKVAPGTGTLAGEPRRLTFGTSVDVSPSASVDATGAARIVFSSTAEKIDLWSIGIDGNRGKVNGELARFTSGAGTMASQLSLSSDGRRATYLSNRDGKLQPWVRNVATGKEVSVTGPGAMWTPQITPDGNSLAWTVFDESGRPSRVFRAAISDGGELGPAELLCDKCGSLISWGPGQTVTYSRAKPDRTVALDLDTGKSYDLLVNPPSNVWGGRFSPDGKWLVFNVTPTPVQSRLYIAPFDPQRRAQIQVSEWLPVTDGKGWDDKPRWSPDGKSLYFVSHRDGFRCIWRQSVDPNTGSPAGDAVAIQHFHRARLSMSNAQMGSLALAVGPRQMIFSLGEVTGNIWMITPGSQP